MVFSFRIQLYCCICSFGYLPGVILWFADVSEPSVSSIFKGWMWSIQPLKMELTEGSETSANYNLTPGRYPKEHIQYSRHGESLKSRTQFYCYIMVWWLPEFRVN